MAHYQVVEGANWEGLDPRLLEFFEMVAHHINLRVGVANCVTVTSVHRPDPGSVHAYGRGIDFTVEGIETPSIAAFLLQLSNHLNIQFPYTTGGGKPGRTVVYRMKTSSSGSDPNHVRHIHLQMPAGGWPTVT